MRLSVAFLIAISIGAGCGPGLQLDQSEEPRPSISGLISLYLFNSELGDISANSEIFDLSNNAFHATALPNGGGLQYVEGALGAAVSFDGVNDHIQCPSESLYDDLDDFSLSVWVKPTSLGKGNSGNILVKGWEVTKGWILEMSVGEAVKFTRTGGNITTNLVVISQGDSVPFGGWTHIVVTTDGDLQASNTKFYLNGKEAEFDSATSGADRDSDVGSTLNIGGRGDLIRNYEGKIDEVAIFDRIIEADEALLLYQTGAEGIDFP